MRVYLNKSECMRHAVRVARRESNHHHSTQVLYRSTGICTSNTFTAVDRSEIDTAVSYISNLLYNTPYDKSVAAPTALRYVPLEERDAERHTPG